MGSVLCITEWYFLWSMLSTYWIVSLSLHPLWLEKCCCYLSWDIELPFSVSIPQAMHGTISYILWIIFVILTPILFTNKLVNINAICMLNFCQFILHLACEWYFDLEIKDYALLHSNWCIAELPLKAELTLLHKNKLYHLTTFIVTKHVWALLLTKA